MSILTNFNMALSYTIETVPAPELVGGTLHYIYNFLADGSTATGVERNYSNTIDNNMAELIFTGGPQPPATSTIRLVSLSNGGLSSNTFFNIYNLGTDVTNQTAMFYGGVPVNSPSGYSGVSYTSLANVALPIKFLNFTALRRGENAILNWQIENETSLTDRYEIERSFDGIEFRKINTLAPKNNGNANNSYDAIDLRITELRSTPIIYYRIKQFDKDDKFVYSNIASVRINSNVVIGIYPNPAHNSTNVSIDLAESANVLINISEASGKQVQTIEFAGFKGLNIKHINLAGFASGTYLLKVHTGDQTQTLSLIKAQ